MNHINIGVRALIRTSNGLIMVEHKEKKNGEILIFPGGGMEPGENIFQAVKREVKEETNLIVRPEKIMYLRETVYGNDSGIEFYVSCSLIDGKMVLGNDPELDENEQVLQAVREVDWEEIKDTTWYPDELHGCLESDIKSDINNIIYLGIKNFN